MQYVALIHKDAGSDYGVSFPDFPGCATAGRTLEDARVMAQEALNLHVEGMIEDGESLPAPSTLDDIMADADNKDAIAVLTVIAQRSSKAVRLNVTLPEDVLNRIDEYARKHGMSRSGFLAQAAKQVLEDA